MWRRYCESVEVTAGLSTKEKLSLLETPSMRPLDHELSAADPVEEVYIGSVASHSDSGLFVDVDHRAGNSLDPSTMEVETQSAQMSQSTGVSPAAQATPSSVPTALFGVANYTGSSFGALLPSKPPSTSSQSSPLAGVSPLNPWYHIIPTTGR